MQRLQKSMAGAIILSEISHVFCCGLPSVFAVLSLLSGLGLATIMPTFLVHIHEILHHYEVTMIVASGAILLLGYILHFISERLNCVDTGCAHPPCEPQKAKHDKVLLVATALYLINLIVYVVFHSGLIL
ncbi:MAG: hypothetical protein AB7E85_04550 [Pseudobdellovibrionaceae bacterium]